jgi:uncharacterized membrane protein
MSKDIPLAFVIAAYNEEKAADQVSDDLKAQDVPYNNLAVVRKTADSKIKIKETGDMSFGPGAGIGAVVGGVLGLFAGPGGLVAGAAAGAAIGGTAAALHDAGIPNERLEKIGDVLNAGSSALIVIGQQAQVEGEKEDLEAFDQSTAEFVEALAEDIRSYQQSGEDVAYFLAVTEAGVVAKKAVVGQEAANISGFVSTPEGVVAGQAVVTPDEVAYEVGAVAGDEAVYQAGVVPSEEPALDDETEGPQEGSQSE